MEIYNKEDYVKEKKAEREEVFKMVSAACYETVYSDNNLKEYLKLQSRFDLYSVSNVMLILKQCPQATKIKDFDYWKNQDFQVKKGEKGIKLIRPSAYTNKDGVEMTVYNIKKYFDISQTNAFVNEKKPRESNNAILKGLISAAPVKVESVESLRLDTTAKALYNNTDKVLYIERGLTPNEFFKNVVQEVAKSILDMDNSQDSLEEVKDKAAMVGYMLAQRYGFEEAAPEVKVPANYEELDDKQIKAELGKCREVFSNIKGSIEKEISKEREQRSQEER